MRNLRNRKRLTLAVIAFMLTFVVGAAFAWVPGALQFAGAIGVGDPELRVRWFEVSNAVNTPVLTPNMIATTNVARIVNWKSRTGAAPVGASGLNDRVEWAVGFRSAGTVTMVARAENYGSLPAQVLAPSATVWDYNNPLYFNMFTVTHTMIATTGVTPVGTWPVVLQPGETMDVQITLVWNGEAPIGGFSNNPLPISPLGGNVPPALNWHFVPAGSPAGTPLWLPSVGIPYPNAFNVLPSDIHYTWANNFFIDLIYTLWP